MAAKTHSGECNDAHRFLYFNDHDFAVSSLDCLLFAYVDWAILQAIMNRCVCYNTIRHEVNVNIPVSMISDNQKER